MSTQPRLSSAVPGAEATFATVTAHAPELMAKFFSLYADLWQNGLIADELREMARLRNARITDCGY